MRENEMILGGITLRIGGPNKPETWVLRTCLVTPCPGNGTIKQQRTAELMNFSPAVLLDLNNIISFPALASILLEKHSTSPHYEL